MATGSARTNHKNDNEAVTCSIISIFLYKILHGKTKIDATPLRSSTPPKWLKTPKSILLNALTVLQKLHLNSLYPVNFLCKTVFFLKYVSISQLLFQTRSQPPESSIGTALVSPEFIAGRSENFFGPRWLTQLKGFDLWAMAVAFLGGTCNQKWYNQENIQLITHVHSCSRMFNHVQYIYIYMQNPISMLITHIDFQYTLWIPLVLWLHSYFSNGP